MIDITVDGVGVQAEDGELLIDACERNGVYIPRFCYHKRMSSVGMCRMCIVEVDTGRGSALQPSCMLNVSPDMAVSTDSDKVKKAQDGVLEFLLINHPLDCPVCDKGGECPLQDQTMAYGPGESRMVEEKRHFEKPIAISETVYLDRERCILCDRCTRFADEVAGDKLIHFMGRGNHTEVNTFADEPFASYFSGNTVQICPVGALTAVPYRFKARPWDLTETPSTAWVDSVGSRVSVQASRNRVVRLLGVDADSVNWGWLSDKERFGFEALNSQQRLRTPIQRGATTPSSAATTGSGALTADGFSEVSWNAAMGQVVELLTTTAPERIGVIGGARLSNEAQYCWAKLAKTVVGTDNVDAHIGDGLAAELIFSTTASINDLCEPGGTVIWMAPDPKEELGSLYLRLRHAVLQDGVSLIELTPCGGGLSELAAVSLHPRPGEVAAVAKALVELVGDSEAKLEDLDTELVDAVREAANLLSGVNSDGSSPVTVVVGRASLAEPAEVVEQAALELSKLANVRFMSGLRRGNIHGALNAGLVPGTGIGAKPMPISNGCKQILGSGAAGELDVLILLGADPLNDFADRSLAESALRTIPNVVSVDMFINDSAQLGAHTVLAASGPTESEGSFTNLEGRLSTLSQKVTPPGIARADWMIAAELMERIIASSGFASLEEVRAEMTEVSPLYAPLAGNELDSTEGALLVRAAGLDNEAVTSEAQSSPGTGTDLKSVPINNGVLPARAAGLDSEAVTSEAQSSPGTGTDLKSVPINNSSLLLIATRRMYDDGVMLRNCPTSRSLAREAIARMSPDTLNRLQLPVNIVVEVAATSSTASSSIKAVLRADAGVPIDAVALDWAAPGAPANALISADESVTAVTVTPSV